MRVDEVVQQERYMCLSEQVPLCGMFVLACSNVSQPTKGDESQPTFPLHVAYVYPLKLYSFISKLISFIFTIIIVITTCQSNRLVIFSDEIFLLDLCILDRVIFIRMRHELPKLVGKK